MSVNVPSYTVNNISFGPAVLYIGVAGTTPSTDYGALAEDGITFNVEIESGSISQGNPMSKIMVFDKMHGYSIDVKGIEWNLIQNLAHQLGSAVTASSSGIDTLSWGGNPIPTELAIMVEHYMAKSGHTLNIDCFKVVRDGGFSVGMGQEVHNIPAKYTGLRTATDWGGTALNGSSQLIRVRRIKT